MRINISFYYLDGLARKICYKCTWMDFSQCFCLILAVRYSAGTAAHYIPMLLTDVGGFFAFPAMHLSGKLVNNPSLREG